MPYIAQDDRKHLDGSIDSLIQNITAKTLKDQTAMAGLLNYTVSRLLMGVILGTGGVRYHKIAAVTGMLQNVADEFYRRVAGPYESDQIKKNGDIKEYASYDNGRTPRP